MRWGPCDICGAYRGDRCSPMLVDAPIYHHQLLVWHIRLSVRQLNGLVILQSDGFTILKP